MFVSCQYIIDPLHLSPAFAKRIDLQICFAAQAVGPMLAKYESVASLGDPDCVQDPDSECYPLDKNVLVCLLLHPGFSVRWRLDYAGP